MSFQFLLCADRGKLPETSGTEKASYGCGLVGYQSFRTTCRGTYGNEAKAIPRIRIYQVSLLTGDALTRSAARKGEWKSGYGLVFTKLYRYLLRPDIYFVAYKNLYANNGAATKGVNEDTADGFSEAKIDSIIKALADETYQPMPVRRTYIQKKNNRKKLRPLGIPTFTDKLVQEVLRMILEAVYEPIFLDVSHGFRPKRSCHTALKQLRREFNGTRWFVKATSKVALTTSTTLFL